MWVRVPSPVPFKIMILSIKNKKLVEAYEKGYRVINGELYNPQGNLLKGFLTDGYKCFKMYLGRRPNRKGVNVKVHRLVAYQKYGDKLFEENIETRHLDNNKLNNFEDNITIGTHSQNMMDKPKEQRLDVSINAASHLRRWTDEEEKAIREFHNEHRSYAMTMKQFGITSKGSLFYILKKIKERENGS